MSVVNDVPADELPGTPDDERILLFLGDALRLLEGGGTINGAAMMADRPDLITGALLARRSRRRGRSRRASAGLACVCRRD